MEARKIMKYIKEVEIIGSQDMHKYFIAFYSIKFRNRRSSSISDLTIVWLHLEVTAGNVKCSHSARKTLKNDRRFSSHGNIMEFEKFDKCQEKMGNP